MYRAFLALRWLFTRRINLLGVLAVTVGVWALVVVVSIFSGYLGVVAKHLQSSTADMTAVWLPDDARFDELDAIIRRDPNVAAAAPRIVWQGLVHPFGTNVSAAAPPVGMAELGAPTPYVSVIGVDFARERDVTGLADWIGKIEDPGLRVADVADPFKAGGEHPGLLVGRKRMTDDACRRGDRAKITTGRLVRDRRQEKLDFETATYVVAGAYESDFSAFEGLNVFVDIGALRGQIHGAGPSWCNEIAIRLHDPNQAEATAARLERMLNVDRSATQRPIAVRTWAEANGPQIANIEHQRSLLKLVLFVIMVVAAFQVYATMSMTVAEKQHDIGILTALGASRGGVLTLFLTSGIAIAVVGAVSGVVLGCLTAIELDPFNELLKSTLGVDLFPDRVYNLRHVPHDLDPLWISQVAGSAILIGAVVSAVPAWRASRHDPAVSLRND